MIGDVTLAGAALVAAVAFAASVLGGVTGYGTGLLLPPVLVPLIGAEAVVPVISLSALMTNASRVVAFRAEFDRRRATLIAGAALLPCALGAYGYTRLSGAGVSVLLGLVLIALVPIRHVLRRKRAELGLRAVAAAGGLYGFVTGASSGAGVMLLSILLASGLSGPAVVATDAGVSLVLGLAKTLVFQVNGSLPLSSWLMAALIGIAATPGAFLAKRLSGRMPDGIQVAVLDGVVLLGGALLVARGLRA